MVGFLVSRAGSGFSTPWTARPGLPIRGRGAHARGTPPGSATRTRTPGRRTARPGRTQPPPGIPGGGCAPTAVHLAAPYMRRLSTTTANPTTAMAAKPNHCIA